MDPAVEDQLKMEQMTEENMSSIEVDLSGNVSVASGDSHHSHGGYIMRLVESHNEMSKDEKRQYKTFLEECEGDEMSDISLTSNESTLSPDPSSPIQMLSWGGWFGRRPPQREAPTIAKSTTSKESKKDSPSNWKKQEECEEVKEEDELRQLQIPPLIDFKDCEHLTELLNRHSSEALSLSEEEETEMKLLQKQGGGEIMSPKEIDQLASYKEKRESRKMFAELMVKFRGKNSVDEYKLCLLELKEISWTGRELSAEESYELELLERHAAGEDLNEEANDLDFFVEKRLMYKSLEIDLQGLREDIKRGVTVDEELLFVCELFERKRLQGPLDKMESLALDLLERDRTGETLGIEEMDKLLDIMEILKDRQSSSTVKSDTKSISELKLAGESNNGMSTAVSKNIDISSESSKSWPWNTKQDNVETVCLIFESESEGDDDKSDSASEGRITRIRNQDVEIENGAKDGSHNRRGWLFSWRAQKQRQAIDARNRVQNRLVNKSIQKAKLLMEIDTLKMDLKEANASVIQFGGERDENTRIIFKMGEGAPCEEFASVTSTGPSTMMLTTKSLATLKSECVSLQATNQQKDKTIVGLEEAKKNNDEKMSILEVESQSKDKTIVALEERIRILNSEMLGMTRRKEESQDLTETQATEGKALKEELVKAIEKYGKLEAMHKLSCSALDGTSKQLNEACIALQATEEERDEMKLLYQTSSSELKALKNQFQLKKVETEATKVERDEIKSVLSQIFSQTENVEKHLKEAKNDLEMALSERDEVKSMYQTKCSELKIVEERFKETTTVLESAEEEREEFKSKFLASMDNYEEFKERYETSTIIVEKFEQEYPEETQARVGKTLLEIGIKSGSVDDLIDSFQMTSKKVDSLEHQLTLVKDEASATAAMQGDFKISVAYCKKLEEDVTGLKEKLRIVEGEKEDARKNAERIVEEMAVTQERVEFLSQHEKRMYEDNERLVAENIELKDLCEEMISGIQSPVDC